MKISCELWEEIKKESGVLCMVCHREVDKPGHEEVQENMITRKETKNRGEDCLIVMVRGKRMGVIHSRPECRQGTRDEWGSSPGWKSETRQEWLRGD